MLIAYLNLINLFNNRSYFIISNPLLVHFMFRTISKSSVSVCNFVMNYEKEQEEIINNCLYQLNSLLLLQHLKKNLKCT